MSEKACRKSNHIKQGCRRILAFPLFLGTHFAPALFFRFIGNFTLRLVGDLIESIGNIRYNKMAWYKNRYENYIMD